MPRTEPSGVRRSRTQYCHAHRENEARQGGTRVAVVATPGRHEPALYRFGYQGSIHMVFGET